MKKRYHTRLSPAQCRARLKQDIRRFAAPFSGGYEQFTGWACGRWFAVSYHDGENSGISMEGDALVRRIRLVRNKAIARITVREGVSAVAVRTYRGCTDILSIAFVAAGLFLANMLITLLSGMGDADAALLVSVWLAAAMTLAWAALTAAWSYLSRAGEDNGRRLLEFLQATLQMEPDTG